MADSGFSCPECGRPANAAGWCTNQSCSSSNNPPGQRPPPAEPVTPQSEGRDAEQAEPGGTLP